MKINRQDLVRTTITFVLLFTAGVLTIAAAYSLAAPDIQPALYSVGNILSSAALAFFLLETFRIEREARG